MPIIELDYHLNTAAYFQALAHLPYAIWLDSCRAFQEKGRFDVMSATPRSLIKNNKGLNQLIKPGESKISSEPTFDLVKSELNTLAKLTVKTELPFTIGALGYYGYDLGRQLEKLPNSLNRTQSLPDACVGIYDWSLIVDHQLQKSYLVGVDIQNLKQIHQLIEQPSQTLAPFELIEPFKADMTREEYDLAFQQIHHHLIQGDCYQVNLCQRFSSRYTGSPIAAYLLLRAKSPAPFAAFMHVPEGAILSLSPERFIEIKNGHALTQPIKGTRARETQAAQDLEAAQQLLNSEKDRAENLMIVDLMRNDLSRSCRPGSVKTPRLFELQSFSNVHHLVSSISGELVVELHPLDLLKNCFPGGSITGAPKISAMSIIEKLENHSRSVYCGSIGYCSIDEQMDSNIAIRTLLCEQNQIYAYAGGGIVIDSDCEAEYQESLTKINNLLRTLNG